MGSLTHFKFGAQSYLWNWQRTYAFQIWWAYSYIDEY